MVRIQAKYISYHPNECPKCAFREHDNEPFRCGAEENGTPSPLGVDMMAMFRIGDETLEKCPFYKSL